MRQFSARGFGQISVRDTANGGYGAAKAAVSRPNRRSRGRGQLPIQISSNIIKYPRKNRGEKNSIFVVGDSKAEKQAEKGESP